MSSGQHTERDSGLTRVLIVSEVCFFRECLAHAFAETRLLGDSLAVEPSAVRAAMHQEPDVVLLHLAVPAGPRMARTIAVLAPRVSVVALAVAEDEATVVAWAEAGVAGYVPSDRTLSQVIESIHVVVSGGAACPPAAAAVLLKRVAMFADGHQALSNLTSRERQIASLIEDGLSNKEIARSLSISLPTVKNHVHNILHKLQIDKRSRVTRAVLPSPSRSGSLDPK